MKYKIILIILSFFIINSYKALDSVTLSKCIDGDTARFIYNGKEEKFRFLAINTPESTDPENIEDYGIEASEYTCRELTNAKKIEIEFDPNSDKQDKYDRYLVWVFVDGELLQEKVVEKGYAEVKYTYGKYKYLDTLYKKQDYAKKNKLGIWSDTEYEIPTNNYIIILSIIGILVILIILYITKIMRLFK